MYLNVHEKLLSQNTIRDILVVVVQLGGQRVQRILHQLIDLALQLGLGEVHVKAGTQISNGTGTAVFEARQLGACG